jgi:hypothetical protein
MRETRTYGSEGGGTELNRSFLPLSRSCPGTARTYAIVSGHSPDLVRLRAHQISDVKVVVGV